MTKLGSRPEWQRESLVQPDGPSLIEVGETFRSTGELCLSTSKPRIGGLMVRQLIQHDRLGVMKLPARSDLNTLSIITTPADCSEASDTKFLRLLIS
jgi:hypothetical protein